MSKKNGKFTMTQKEAQIIVDGIVHWEKGGDAGKCPICDQMRNNNGDSEHCVICPVARYTGDDDHCSSTPVYSTGRRQGRVIAFGIKMLDDAGYKIVEVNA